MSETIKDILIRRDDMDPQDADFLIEEARETLQELIADDCMDEAYNICNEYFGLEPDYITELL